MRPISKWAPRVLVLLVSPCLMAPDCEGRGVGDPCIPQNEYSSAFVGFSESQVYVESRSFQCRSRLCLVNHFRGRVSCPYGQGNDGGSLSSIAPEDRCRVPGVGASDGPLVDVVVEPQLRERPPTDAVHCSCRCDGPNPTGQYCKCPSGFSCQELITDVGFGGDDAGGFYCVRDGAYVGDPEAISQVECDRATRNCGDAHPFAGAGLE